MESKILDLVSKKLISICGGKFMCSSWEIFLKKKKKQPKQHTPPELNQTNAVLVNCFYALCCFESMSYFMAISLHATSSMMPKSYKSCCCWPPIWQHCSRKYPRAVFHWQKPKWGRRSLLLYWPLAVHLLTMLCLNYKPDQIWKLTVDLWCGRVNLEESHVETLKLEGIVFWGIVFGSNSKLQLLTALNVFPG